jgi:hypothetical protein
MRRFFVLAIAAPLVLAGCSSGGSNKKTGASTTSSSSATAVVAQSFSPEANSTQGVCGVGMTFDLAFRSKETSLVKAGVRTAGQGQPGRNAAIPGFVATLTTTDTALGGPQANLANLFQLVGVSQQPDGSAEVWVTWVNAAAKFGVELDSVFEAYLVAGDAPATVTADRAGLDVRSNVIHTAFHVAGAVPGGPPCGTATSSSSSSTTGRTTTTVRTTTSKATTTTKATTSTSSPPVT